MKKCQVRRGDFFDSHCRLRCNYDIVIAKMKIAKDFLQLEQY